MKYLHVLFFAFSVATLSAETIYTDAGPQNNFRSASNPYYWANRKPFPGYWQQDVHYTIHATVDESTDIIGGEEELVYYNNSPDTLHELYFHLYQNAFQPGSYLDNLQRNNDVHPSYGKYEKKGLGTVIDKIQINDKPVKQTLDNTILKVELPAALLPSDSVVVTMQFRTFYDSGSTRRRMKKYKAYGYKHYNGCQWYPKVCVYDRKTGWNTDQHLNREFYGDYGTFDVRLTFASNYILEATGALQNEGEVLPDTLKQKLSIRNFANKKWESAPDTIIPYKKGETKTWYYHAENVHDFAFTADPTYRILDTIIYPGRVIGEGVRCVAIVQEPHASGWQNAAEYLSKIITVFSRDFGVFEYPKIVVADAADGMEYPMLTLDGGREPDYYGLLVHEVGHNWFYGMIGNNETYRPMLDEGFTQFLTAWGMEALNGDTIVHEPIKNRYVRKFSEPQNVREYKCYYSYLSDAILYNDEPINTHSDAFNGALGQGGGYRHAYAKTATMLYNLQYVLGDSLFLNAMKDYVSRWKFAHPYPEDFRNSITHYTHTDLNWFFDEWMETTKNIDYKILSVRKDTIPNGYRIKLKRKGRMQMPIDLRVVNNKDSIFDFYIPNKWFVKHPDNLYHNFSVLPKWYGWDKLQPTYTAHVTIPHGIKKVVIDPTERLADINMLDNRTKGNVEVRFDSRIYPPVSTKKYRLYLRPDVWWNAYDGFKVGMNISGNYMNVKHNFSFTWWLNTHIAQGGIRYYLSDKMKPKAGYFSYIFNYSTAIDKLFRKSTFYFHSRWLDGCEMYKVGITKQLPQSVSLDFHIKAFTHNREEWRSYLLYPNEWSTIWTSSTKFNASLNVSASYKYSTAKVNGELKLRLRSGLVSTSSDYHYVELQDTMRIEAWKFDFKTRVYARYGTGKSLPSESALFFAGGNPEEMMDSKYYRTVGFVPQSMAYSFRDNINHLHFGGGLNMRGYVGYLLAERDKNGQVVPAYKGSSGAAINVEMDFNRLVTVKNAKLREWVGLNTYLFADAGSIVYSNSLGKNQFSSIRADAGVGMALTLRKWGSLQNIKPLTLRFDVPFFVSHAPYANPRHFDFRWVIGVSRAF